MKKKTDFVSFILAILITGILVILPGADWNLMAQDNNPSANKTTSVAPAETGNTASTPGEGTETPDPDAAMNSPIASPVMAGTVPVSAPGMPGDATKKAVIRYGTLVGIPVTTYFFAIFAWQWGERDHWKWGDEGWFGENTYQGGEDKLAHIYSHYLVMRAAYNIFDYTENGGPRKWWYSIGLTSLIGMSIEVGDAYSGENGFCYQDLIADALGITLGAMLEKYPVADHFIGYSAGYIPTKYFREHPGTLWKFPDDYSGWKFMLNFKLAGFEYIGIDIPDFLRYVMIDFGFYARGYNEKYGQHGVTDPESKKRYLFIGASINLMEVVNSCFDRKPSRLNSALQQPFKYYHVPLGYAYDMRVD